MQFVLVDAVVFVAGIPAALVFFVFGVGYRNNPFLRRLFCRCRYVCGGKLFSDGNGGFFLRFLAVINRRRGVHDTVKVGGNEFLAGLACRLRRHIGNVCRGNFKRNVVESGFILCFWRLLNGRLGGRGRQLCRRVNGFGCLRRFFLRRQA